MDQLNAEVLEKIREVELKNNETRDKLATQVAYEIVNIKKKLDIIGERQDVLNQQYELISIMCDSAQKHLFYLVIVLVFLFVVDGLLLMKVVI